MKLLLLSLLFSTIGYGQVNQCPPVPKTEFHSLTGNGWRQVYWFNMIRTVGGKFYATITYDYYNLINGYWVRSAKPQLPTYYLAKNNYGYAIAVDLKKEALITNDTCLLKRMIMEEINEDPIK